MANFSSEFISRVRVLLSPYLSAEFGKASTFYSKVEECQIPVQEDEGGSRNLILEMLKEINYYKTYSGKGNHEQYVQTLCQIVKLILQELEKCAYKPRYDALMEYLNGLTEYKKYFTVKSNSSLDFFPP